MNAYRQARLALAFMTLEQNRVPRFRAWRVHSAEEGVMVVIRRRQMRTER
jgi:hypothetical protein